MTKRRLQLFSVLLCIVTMACGLNRKDAAQPVNAIQEKQRVQGLSLEIPDARWEPTFFEALEKLMKKAGLPSLRRTRLADQDLEVRFWYDHFEIIEGLIIRRSGEKWSATYLRQKNDHEPSSVQQKSLGVPNQVGKIHGEG